ncbi:hypothetical protein [Lacticaseibacillus pantheris]|uniref:hypothetical protein n=1 Tax=Lacticaseibacillus pantheris TaxID=171523 RepID=UPI0026598D45|nr:hypothetical protein [Lacticaseibacillus pantheris]WKF84831.1 hypothetical protein QY874_11210 [Lacticaseibacillus pantheris]
MLMILMLLYAVILAAIAWYLLSHQTKPFLTFTQPSTPLAQAMGLTGYSLIVAAVLSLVSAFVNIVNLALVALVLGAAIMGLFALSFTRYL